MRAESDGVSSGRNVRREATPVRTSEPPLTLSEAAVYLNVSQRFMRRLVAERRIAFHKLGHLLRFRVADLDLFMSAGRIEPAEEPLLRQRGC
jgi:excisionase family DNA binding protein